MARLSSVAAALGVAVVAGPSGAGLAAAELRYDGTASPRLVTDLSHHGRHGRVLTANGGRVLPLTGENGDRYLRFPGGPCLRAPCPQAVIVPPRPPPPPGAAPFSFGADVRLTAAPPAAGMNVWQAGLAGPGHAQWKLQVDGGRPACRWSDGTRAVLLHAGGLPLDTGHWYRLRCTRLSRTLFEILVRRHDGGAQIAYASAPLGPISPAGPATIGGKRVRAGQNDTQTDQFHGDLDEVYLTRR